MDASPATASADSSGSGHASPKLHPVPGSARRQQAEPEPPCIVLHPILQHPFVEAISEHLRKQEQPEATPETVCAAYVGAYNSPTCEAIIGGLHQYLPDADSDLVRRAYALSTIAHAGQYRQSGEPYIDHPVAVTSILLELRLDAESLAASLLHDVVEDTGVSLEVIKGFFGANVAHLVDGVTKLSSLEIKSKEERQAGSYRKMFIATADDPRVILIKLADRLHNMRTLGATPPAKQKRIARETLDIYAPLAHRLGMWQVKSELEDLAFKASNPEQYKEIADGLSMRKEARERTVQRVIRKMREALQKEGIQAQVSGRPKHIYSIWRKMDRKGVPLEQIYDQLAIRVIVQEQDPDRAKGICYRMLGLVHSIWTPVLSEFNDYIAVPKESSYQSLHTTVIIPGGQPCEVQIRTEHMHRVAEHGIAAHWRYKEGFTARADQNYEAKIKWLRELISWRIELSDAEFVASLKPELEELVYLFTPKGRIIDLPDGATPVDFAYHVHSEVGNHCIGAKVNGRLVPLDYRLQNGEIVDIMTVKSDKGPSRDWLNFVQTPSARNHIKRFFRRAERDDNVSAGRDLLEKELKRLGLTVSFDHLVDLMGARSVEELFNQIGTGETTARSVAQKALSQQVDQQQPELPTFDLPIPPAPVRSQPVAVGVQVAGVGAVHNRLAKCCGPVVGEPIVGFVTRGRGITVHRAECRTIVNERDRNRLIDVVWGGQQPKGYSVPVRVESWDRVGLWRDISNIIADAGINIEKLEQGQTRRVGRAVLHVMVSLQSVNQLSMLLDKLNRITDVIEARRESGAVKAAGD